ncbi:MAG: DNA polymerase/3'-5' exonuclease PolX [Nanoarchaeota archaeon]
MINKELIEILNNVANAYEIKGVEWKPIAYRTAANSIENLNHNITKLYEKKGINALKKLPGVGESIAKHLEEYILNGKVKEFEELFKQIPLSQSLLMKIEGLGPKKIKELQEELKISNIKDLKEAIEQDKIKELERFGQKTQDNIKKSIQRYEKVSERMLISEAMPIAEEIIEKLKAKSPIDKIIYAGSLRRQKETIGDIDILAFSKEPQKVIDVFTNMDDISDIISKGKSKSTIILKNNIQIDLRLIDKKSFGAAMQYFTGSKEHNIELRKIAQKKGYKLSEYGLYNKKNKKIAGEKEEDIYNKLKMQWIPPELRENKGEIETAKKNQIPKLIKLKDIKGDLHIHSKLTDGNNTIKEIVDATQEKGYEYIAISDHSKSAIIASGLSKNELKKEIKEIDKLQKNSQMKILKSSEIDILEDGSLDYDDDTLQKLDIKICSIHKKFKLSKKDMTNRILNAINNENLDILGHPLCRIIGKRAEIEFDSKKIYKEIAKNNKCLEINSNPKRLDLNDINIKFAKECGAKFVINTDTHNISNLNFIKYGISQARRGWLTKNDVINTLPYKDFIKHFKNKK